ncbi:unnamed protein product [Candida verbasci]|uniref:CTLH domain-containing protein n=1 Tax=Candida verbasci TaxID=1227364 RepID=A0A9W4TVH6_9ASCO|nr:unnamed protein product [Candida verbasci]
MNLQQDKNINHLILDYLIQQGHKDAIIQFTNDINMKLVSVNQEEDLLSIDPTDPNFQSKCVEYYSNTANELVESPLFTNKMKLDYKTIKPRKILRDWILSGKIKEAIQAISYCFPTILDSNNLLHFKLLRLNIVEMIRNHRLNEPNQDEREFLDEILTFVRNNLINKVSNSYKLRKELEITMSLLCFKFDPKIKDLQDQKDLPDELKNLFNLSLRSQCFKLVNKAILNLYNEKEDDEEEESSESEETDTVKKEKVYKGPQFIQLDLDKISLDPDSVSDDEEIGYNIDSGISQVEPDEKLKDISDKDDDEITKLTNLSLESNLEKIIKLYILTEERLYDLNLISETRYQSILNK